MKRYKFRLEPLLRYRQLIEDKLQRELAEIKRRLYEEETRLTQLKNMQTQAQHELSQSSRRKTFLNDLVLYRAFLSRMFNAIAAQKQRIEIVAQELERKRREVIEAMKKKKVLQRLKEKDWQTYKMEVNKLELKFIDEVATNAFNRESRSSFSN